MTTRGDIDVSKAAESRHRIFNTHCTWDTQTYLQIHKQMYTIVGCIHVLQNSQWREHNQVT